MTTTTRDQGAAAVILGLYEGLGAGDLSAIAASLHDDVVLHVPGTQPQAGDHVGVRAVVDFIAASSARADRTERVDVVDVLAGATHAAALCHVTGRREGHPALDNRTVHLFRLDGDRIAEVWFHNWDQGAVDAFWS